MDIEELKTLVKEKFLAVSSQFSRGQLVVIVLLLFLLVIGSTYLYLRRQPNLKLTQSCAREIKDETSNKRQTSAKLIVHVAGAVNHPDVYELNSSSRVIDAIKAAGGATCDAELDALNLAAKVSDGEKVYVPKKGEKQVAQTNSMSYGDSPLININTASGEELDKLPGIGPTLAERIAEYRQSRGGFKSVEELREVEGIGPKKFQQLKDKVTI